ncbi:MAG: Gfo/Idh/MocA family oxidoreductase [Bacilli bacterium]|nr:Gfo/Idh/MocA family oxidoreductase [Bacilli bacterium]
MLKVGQIGCGGIGGIHACCWKNLQDKVQLVAVADFNVAKAKEISKDCGAKVYEDAIQMLENENLDIVDICLPTFLHAQYVIDTMKYVKNIIVEKPLCLNAEEAEEIKKAAQKYGATVLVGHVVRFSDTNDYLAKLIKSGEYGRVIEANFYRISPKPVWVKDYENVNKTGGMPIDLHIHDVDYIRYIMGSDPKDVESIVIRNENGIVENIWSSYFYDGAVIHAEASWIYPVCMKFKKSARVRLEKAVVEFSDNNILTVYPEDGEAFSQTFAEKNMDFGINISDMMPFYNELSSFIAYIEGDKKAKVVTLDDAIAALKLVIRELDTAKACVAGRK